MDVILGRSTRLASIARFSPLCATNNFLESVRFIRCTDSMRWRLKLTERCPCYENSSCSYVPFFRNVTKHELPVRYNYRNGTSVAGYCNSKQAPKGPAVNSDSTEKVSLFKKMKQMTKDYWYILIPVHIVTSLGWVAMFYAAIKNGVDIVQIMEYMNFSDKYLNMVKNSSAGNWAFTYALYKIFTPLRYMVTIGFSTMAVKYFSKTGLVKPMTYGKQSKVTTKTTKSNGVGVTHKVEQQTEPPKT